jgi:hypothetical protein
LWIKGGGEDIPIPFEEVPTLLLVSHLLGVLGIHHHISIVTVVVIIWIQCGIYHGGAGVAFGLLVGTLRRSI